jgi:hypothetical protein
MRYTPLLNTGNHGSYGKTSSEIFDDFRWVDLAFSEAKQSVTDKKEGTYDFQCLIRHMEIRTPSERNAAADYLKRIQSKLDLWDERHREANSMEPRKELEPPLYNEETQSDFEALRYWDIACEQVFDDWNPQFIGGQRESEAHHSIYTDFSNFIPLTNKDELEFLRMIEGNLSEKRKGPYPNIQPPQEQSPKSPEDDDDEVSFFKRLAADA